MQHYPADVRLLEVAPGMRVLEVGAGSGYTGALLGRIVGEHGTVISLDVAPGLVARAARKHSEHGVRNVEVHTADGFGGWSASAAYDRIIGWTAPHVLPRSWIEQVRDRAVIVTPVKVAPIADANIPVPARSAATGPRRRSVRFLTSRSVAHPNHPAPILDDN
ncbi:MAG: methyltransferase domain-containing protein [Pseudonocardiaceae bacterium]